MLACEKCHVVWPLVLFGDLDAGVNSAFSYSFDCVVVTKGNWVLLKGFVVWEPVAVDCHVQSCLWIKILDRCVWVSHSESEGWLGDDESDYVGFVGWQGQYDFFGDVNPLFIGQFVMADFDQVAWVLAVVVKRLIANKQSGQWWQGWEWWWWRWR